MHVKIRRRMIYIFVLKSSYIVCWIKSNKKLIKKKIDIFTLHFSGSRIFNSLTVSFLATCNSWGALCCCVEADTFLIMFVDLPNLYHVVMYIKKYIVSYIWKGDMCLWDKKKLKSYSNLYGSNSGMPGSMKLKVDSQLFRDGFSVCLYL